MSVCCPSVGTARVHAARYTVGGIGMEVRCADRAVAELIGARLRRHRGGTDTPAPVVFDIRSGDEDGFAFAPSGPARPVYDTPGGAVMYFEEEDRLFVDYKRTVRVLCDPCAGVVQVAVCRRDPGNVLAAHPFFTIPLLELMKRRGRYPVHAACVARRGRGVMLAGASGAGKSTLSLALVRAGWDFVTDDMVFLHHGAGSLTAAGLCDPIDVSDDTAAMFPGQLRHLRGRAPGSGRPKHPVDPQAIFGAAWVPACRPGALVLPVVSGARRSRIEPVPASVALRELAPNVLLTRATAAQAHLDALSELVQLIPCFSLSTGTDLDDAVRCLDRVLG